MQKYAFSAQNAIFPPTKTIIHTQNPDEQGVSAQL
nr:MAG TPA_asm: hypothetical protein [Caudoviricetes sp.]